MGLAHTNRFRGSAAFFALLLAASGAGADSGASDTTPRDATPSDSTADLSAPGAMTNPAPNPAAARSTLPACITLPVGQAIVPASKFSRRRQSIARPGALLAAPQIMPPQMASPLSNARQSLSA